MPNIGPKPTPGEASVTSLLSGPLLVAVFWFGPYIFPPVEGIVSETDLQSVAGTVMTATQLTPRTRLYRPAYVQVVVDIPGRVPGNYLQDFEITDQAPGLLQLQGGDHVTMLIESRASTKLDNGIDGRLWELKRDDATILGYDTTRQYVKRVYGDPILRDHMIALGVFVVWIILLWRGAFATDPEDLERRN